MQATNLLGRAALVLASACVCAAMAPRPVAAGEPEEKDRWKVTFSPYLWAAGLKGTTTVGPTKSDVDMDFGDVLSNLKCGMMADLRVEKGRWTIGSNLLWADLQSEVGSRRLRADVEVNLWIIELDAQYRLTDHFKLLAGMRYYALDLAIDGKGRLGISLDGDEDWIDPIGGLVFSYPLSERWSFHARGDVGGFGVGSELSWQVWALLDYRLTKNTSLILGYRHLDWDYERSGGRRRFEMDAHMTGPVLGARFRF